MTSFACRTRNEAGSVIEKVIQANSKREALTLLQRDGLFPISVSAVAVAEYALGNPPEVSKGSGRTLLTARQRKKGGTKVSRKELMQFSLQLSGSLSAGIPIMGALKSVRGLIKNPNFKRVLAGICVDLESGISLSEAMEKHPRVFPAVYTGTISAGEKSGTLDNMLENLAEYLEADMEVRSDLKSAIMYPAIVIVTLCIAIVVLMVFVVPRFATFYSGFGSELPLATKILINGSDFISNNLLFIVGGLVALGFALKALLRRPKVQRKMDRIILKIPVIGKLVQTAITLQVIQILGLFTQAGVPILEALQTAASTTGNSKIKQDILNVATEISVGETMTTGMEKSDCFPQEARQMLANGESTGSMERACFAVVRRFKKELRYQTKTVATLIEPLLTLVLAVIVLFVALAVFLPMWDMVKVVE
ncbi:MAG: type II secretion system F family protein [Planctomycetes bacterium]|nr:type II secretion system F family protein [Planctomycetota bacterium]